MSGGINDDVNGGNESTEDDILNQVEDITGDNFDGEGNENEEDDKEESEDVEDGSTNEQTTEEDAKPREQRLRNRDERKQARSGIPSQRRVDYDYDRETGDVIDPKTGNVIYATGTPARDLFAELQNTRYQASRMQQDFGSVINEARRLEQIVEGYKRAPSVADQLKLSTEDQVIAFQHMAAFRADPAKALRKMLNDFQVDGGDLTDIFENLEKIQLEGLEARLGKQIETLTKPQQDAAAEQRRRSELENSIGTEISTFFRSNPDAEPHAGLLAHVINRAAEQGQRMTLADAWVNVLKFANARGLNLNEDLQAQLQPPQPKVQRRPMAQGRSSASNLRTRESTVPSYDRRSRDIVAESMREAGFDI